MKKCEKCQKEFTDDVNFCNQCGSPLVTSVAPVVPEVVETIIEPIVEATSSEPTEKVVVTPVEQTPEVEIQPESVGAQSESEPVTPSQPTKDAEEVADEFYHKSKETIKNVGSKVNSFIDKPDEEFDPSANNYGQKRVENYGLYYVKIFRVLIIILSVLVFLVSAFSAFQMGYFNPVGALIGLFTAVIGACFTYFLLNFSLKMFENIARIGRNLLDIRNMMMEDRHKKN